MFQRSIFQTNEKFLTVSFSVSLSYFWKILKCTILFLFCFLVGRGFFRRSVTFVDSSSLPYRPLSTSFHRQNAFCIHVQV